MILIFGRNFASLAGVVLIAAAGFGRVDAQDLDGAAAARRLADIATIALSEYQEGVVDGQVVRVEELNEARLFLEQARRAAAQLGPDIATRIRAILEGLTQGVDQLRPASELQQGLASLRAELEASLGIVLDPFPSDPPSFTRGSLVYEGRCVQCHGVSGGALAASLDPRPADLTDAAALRDVTVVDYFRKINVGVAGTAMPGFSTELDLSDRWAVALYASTLRQPRGDVDHAAMRGLVEARCADCLLFLSEFAATARLSDDSLRARLAVPLQARQDTTVAKAVAYARVAGAREFLGGDRALRAARVVAQSKALVEQAMAAVRDGDRRVADTRALDAYLVFEAIETSVRARDAGAAAWVEGAFAEFRAALAGGGAVEQAAARREVEAALEGALDRLTARPSSIVLLGQSLVIMLREGLEAILVIGALVAFLTKAGADEQKREIGRGVVAALVASGVTAAALATLFRSAAAHKEALEGITMLVAAAVLFAVSYWLVSKIEVRKWQTFVRTQMQRALSSKRSYALAAVAFLAVYREGFETVLFYAALFTSADGAVGGISAIVTGIGLGAAALGLVYYLMQRFGVRLPLKPFFAVTSGLLYVMAFSFAGQGVFELQQAGVISMTPLSWLPSLPALGVFPTLQTLASQMVLAVALAAALFWVFWLEPKTMREQVSA